MRSTHPSTRAAFTLTELLVVIAILAILASLAAVGIMRALDTAKQARIKVEVDNLDAAFKAYKEKYGSYPPCDLTNDNALKAHVARAFPRYYDISQAPADIGLVVDRSERRPDVPLVFWLNGFNPDPTHPFLSVDTLPKSQRTPPLFDFDPTRLVNLRPATKGLSYVPSGVKNNAPYVYFDSGFYGYGNTYSNMNSWACNSATYPGVTSGAGYAMPYVKDSGPTAGVFDWPSAGSGDEWVNLDSFQIISCGLDGKFGSATPDPTNTVRLYPTGNLFNPALPYGTASPPSPPKQVGYDPQGADDDNITNFCERARLGDAKP